MQKKKIKKYSIPYLVLDFNSYDFKIINEIKTLINLYKVLKKYKPDIFHTVAPKTNLYGGFISLFLKINTTILSFSGMGFLFTGKLSYYNSIKKNIYIYLLKIILLNKNIKIIVQNKTDYNFFKLNFDNQEKIKLIKGGSGININTYKNIKKKNNNNVVFSGRLVANKGIREFIEAAKVLKKDFPKWNFFNKSSVRLSLMSLISSNIPIIFFFSSSSTRSMFLRISL